MLQFLGDRNNVDTTVIDFCATFFDSLAEHGKLETKKPFNRSRVKYNRLNGNIKNSEAFNANASKWLRFIPEIKQSIIMGLLHVRILQLRFPVNEDLGVVPDNHVCFTEAPFDAESMVLALAYILGEGPWIISVDGDLLAYGGYRRIQPVGAIGVFLCSQAESM